VTQKKCECLKEDFDHLNLQKVNNIFIKLMMPIWYFIQLFRPKQFLKKHYFQIGLILAAISKFGHSDFEFNLNLCAKTLHLLLDSSFVSYKHLQSVMKRLESPWIFNENFFLKHRGGTVVWLACLACNRTVTFRVGSIPGQDILIFHWAGK